MSYTVSYQNKTFQEWSDEIAAYQVSDYWGLLSVRLTDEQTQIRFSAEPNDYSTLELYKVVGFNPDDTPIEEAVTKPLESAYTTELESYKAEQVASITATFDELQRIEDWTVRYDAMEYPLDAAISEGYEGKKHAALADVIATDNETLMAALEAYSQGVAAQVADSIVLSEKLSKASHGTLVIAKISVMNDAKNSGSGLTVPEVLALNGSVDVNSARSLLQDGSLDTAKSLVQSMDLSSLPWDEADRTSIIGWIDEFSA